MKVNSILFTKDEGNTRTLFSYMGEFWERFSNIIKSSRFILRYLSYYNDQDNCYHCERKKFFVTSVVTVENGGRGGCFSPCKTMGRQYQLQAGLQ